MPYDLFCSDKSQSYFVFLLFGDVATSAIKAGTILITR